MKRLTIKRGLECGYFGRDDLKRADALSEYQRRQLAAMVIALLRSPWSDRVRDLERGADEALGDDKP